MTDTNWKQTHVITAQGSTFPVMRIDCNEGGVSFYSPAEWEACVAAYWTLDPERGLLGGGQVIDGSSYQAAVPLPADALSGRFAIIDRKVTRLNACSLRGAAAPYYHTEAGRISHKLLGLTFATEEEAQRELASWTR